MEEAVQIGGIKPNPQGHNMERELMPVDWWTVLISSGDKDICSDKRARRKVQSMFEKPEDEVQGVSVMRGKMYVQDVSMFKGNKPTPSQAPS